MTEPTVIRASALSGYPDCPRRTAARLFRDEIEDAGFRLRRTPRGIGAAIGTAVHEAARTTLGNVARGRRLPAASVAQECAAAALGDELGRGEVIFDIMTRSRREAFGQVTRMTGAFHRVIAPQVRPILVEEQLEATIGPGLVLSGQPDTVAREPGRIRDLKSGARASPGSHAPNSAATVCWQEAPASKSKTRSSITCSGSTRRERNPTRYRRRSRSRRPRRRRRTLSGISRPISGRSAKAIRRGASYPAIRGRFWRTRRRSCAARNTARPSAPTSVTKATRKRRFEVKSE